MFERCSREVPTDLPALAECYSPRWLRQLEKPESVEPKINALIRLLNALVAFDRARFDNFLRVKKVAHWAVAQFELRFRIAYCVEVVTVASDDERLSKASRSVLAVR